MSSLWTIDGVLQLNADGSLIYDVRTPMEICCCPCHIYSAIRERQVAAGLSGGGLIDNTGGTAYNLTQLKAYVNAIADDFISGSSYSGGADPPTMLTSSYADDASNEAELLVLVKAMLVTKLSVSISEFSWWGGYAENSVLADAKTAALADWQEKIPGYPPYPPSADLKGTDVGYDPLDSVYGASTTNKSPKYQITGMATAIAKTASVFVQALAYQSGGFYKHGDTVPDENMYGSVYSFGSGFDATLTTGYVISLDEATTFITWSGPPPNQPAFYGYEFANPFALITWDFDCI